VRRARSGATGRAGDLFDEPRDGKLGGFVWFLSSEGGGVLGRLIASGATSGKIPIDETSGNQEILQTKCLSKSAPATSIVGGEITSPSSCANRPGPHGICEPPLKRYAMQIFLDIGILICHHVSVPVGINLKERDIL
jgi:hypothetical protein